MEQLLSKSDALARQTSMVFRRDALPGINWNNRLLGIKGARGTGKTTILLQRLRELELPVTQAAYFSLDDLYFTTQDLSPNMEQYCRQGGQFIFLDEVHKYPGWARAVKNLYDYYPKLHIVFTGSSIIDLAREEADLSRRALMHELPGLSYREYLSFSQGIQIPSFTLTDILDQNAPWRSHLPANFRPLEHFRDYLAFGYHPFALEDKAGYHQRLQQMVRQVVEFDMAELQG
jgi:predicted AAA+ superfamily ATPase